jgi:PhnB protein
MSSRLNPYINFDGNAREAMGFYQQVLGGDLKTNTYGEFGQDGPLADRIMHAQLETPSGYTIMGADLPPGAEFQAGNTITVSISGDDADELRGYWDGLSAGGTVTVPLEKQMWGDEFGACVDRFGVQWMVDITPPQA